MPVTSRWPPGVAVSLSQRRWKTVICTGRSHHRAPKMIVGRLSLTLAATYAGVRCVRYSSTRPAASTTKCFASCHPVSSEAISLVSLEISWALGALGEQFVPDFPRRLRSTELGCGRVGGSRIAAAIAQRASRFTLCTRGDSRRRDHLRRRQGIVTTNAHEVGP